MSLSDVSSNYNSTEPMKKISLSQSVILLISVLLITACGPQSVGERRANDVIKRINSGMTGPELQQQINKDGEELKGQDLLDYYEVLQKHGVF